MTRSQVFRRSPHSATTARLVDMVPLQISSTLLDRTEARNTSNIRRVRSCVLGTGVIVVSDSVVWCIYLLHPISLIRVSHIDPRFAVSVNMNPIPELTPIPPTLPRATSANSLDSLPYPYSSQHYQRSGPIDSYFPNRYSPSPSLSYSFPPGSHQDATKPFTLSSHHLAFDNSNRGRSSSPYPRDQQQQQYFSSSIPSSASSSNNLYYVPPASSIPTTPSFDPIQEWTTKSSPSPIFSDPFAPSSILGPHQLNHAGRGQALDDRRNRAITDPWNTQNRSQQGPSTEGRGFDQGRTGLNVPGSLARDARRTQTDVGAIGERVALHSKGGW